MRLNLTRPGLYPAARSNRWLLQRRLQVILLALLAIALAVPTVALSIRQPLYGIGAAYVAGFLAVAWRWPQVALMLIFASAPFQTDVSGGGGPRFSVTEVNLALTLPVFYLHALKRKSLTFTTGPLTLPVLLYFCICLYSSWQNWLGSAATTSLFQMFNYMVLAVAMFATFADRCERNLLSLNALLAVGVFLALYKLSGAEFLGLNKNGIGGSLSCALVVCMELWFAAADHPKRQRWLLLALLVMTPALILTLSRGAWLAALVGCFAVFSLRRQWQQFLRVILVMIPVIAVCWSLLPKADREYATGFDKKRENISLRYESVEIARKHFEKRPIYGDGVGWRKLYDATNTAMLLLAETGVLGLLSFGLIHLVFFRMVWGTQKRLPRTDPAYSFLAVGAALVLGKLMHGMVDHYWSRGAVTLAWSGAGMALGAYYKARNQPMLSPVRRADEPEPLTLPAGGTY